MAEKEKFDRSLEHVNIGTIAVDSWFWIAPRRLFKSPMTLPIYSSGTTTSTFMIGSIMTGSAFFIASLNAMEPAMENAISEESTS